MGALALVALVTAADPDDGLSKKLRPVYTAEAEAYSLTVESAPKKPLELKKEPILDWVNRPRGRGETQGALFVWLRDGRPAVVASIFSYPHVKLPGRTVTHELHALDPEKIVVKREGNEWKPEAGLDRKELTDAPVPADTPAARLIQIKKLAAEFTGSSTDRQKQRLELRLLPTPLFRYPVAKAGVIDGALFALVTDTSTDPEVLLLIEANEVAGKVRWEYACGRFSDLELRVQRKDKEVFASVPSETNPSFHGPQHLYRLYPEKVVTPEGKLLARIRQNQNGKPELLPTEDK